MPKVSVLIPTYNCAKYIGQAIQSVLDQTFTDFEIIISDNASIDNTEEVVKKFKDSRIRFYKNQENIGYTKNVYRLIHELSRGEYCIVLCADDYWEGEILKEAIELFETYNELSFVFTKLIVRNEFLKKDIYINNQLPDVMEGFEFFKQHITGKIAGLIPSNVLFKKELALTVNGFGNFLLRYVSDWELRLKLSLLGNVGYIKPLTVYRWHRDNLSTSSGSHLDKFVEGILCIDNVINYAKNKGIGIDKLVHLKNAAIRNRCLSFLGRLGSLKIEGAKTYELLSLVKNIYEIDKYTFFSFSALKALLILFPTKLLKILKLLKARVRC